MIDPPPIVPHNGLDMDIQTDPIALIRRIDKNDPDIPIERSSTALTIGKASENDLSFPEDRTVSRHHCAIHLEGDSLFLEDLNSTNGTYLNGKRIQGRIPLPLESQVTVGRTHFLVVPPNRGYDSQALIDSAYATKDSILIPATQLFEKRTEAFLVVDLVKSTELLRKQDDLFLIKLVATMGKILERALDGQEKSFMKCTGDGFLTRFDTADVALSAMQDLDRGVSRHFPEYVKIAVAMHWGSALYREEEGLIGKDIHAIFSLEKVRSESLELRGLLSQPEIRCLAVMTEPFQNHLAPDSRIKTKCVGNFHLKGLDTPQDVYLWLGD